MTGLNNSFFGAHAGGANTTGNYNTFIGTGAGLSNTEGEKNTFIGEETGVSNSIGNNNTYNGFLAGYSNTTGNENTFYGSKAGYSNGTGEGNVSLGYKAGYNETGSNKLYIENSDTSTPLIYGEFDNDRIGINRVATTNTLEVGGDASKASAGDWLANSDARLKKNIKQLSSEKVLNQILQLQGVTYEWNDDKTGNIRPEGIQYGFTAQNIKEVFPTLVNEDNTGYLQTAYGTYDAMTVEAIRALNDKIDNQSAEISKLKKENEVLKNQAAKINQLETMMAELQSQIQGNNIADNSEN
jgi:cell division protein FtsB